MILPRPNAGRAPDDVKRYIIAQSRDEKRQDGADSRAKNVRRFFLFQKIAVKREHDENDRDFNVALKVRKGTDDEENGKRKP